MDEKEIDLVNSRADRFYDWLHTRPGRITAGVASLMLASSMMAYVKEAKQNLGELGDVMSSSENLENIIPGSFVNVPETTTTTSHPPHLEILELFVTED